ncbi:MAG: iron-siderophore ABC transporter substrate-binding protein [Chloroflexota bacterium]
MQHLPRHICILIFVILTIGCTVAPTPQSTSIDEGTMPETRTVSHALGETEVPFTPQRIVSLNPIVTDNLIALGIKPAAIATFNGSDFTSYEYMATTLADVPIIGTFAEPNQEAIVQLKPDLIIGRDREMGETYDTLSQIAPTVAIADQTDFRSWLALVAEAVGMSEVVSDRLAEFEAKAASAQTALTNAVGDDSAIFLRVRPDQIRIYTSLRIGGPILYNELGLAQPAFVAALPEDNFVQLSLEEIPQLAEADHIFLLDQSKTDEPEPIFSSPLWESLPAVQNNQVYEARRDTWINLGILGSEAVIDDVVLALTGAPLNTQAVSASDIRLISHALGESEVSANPQRVVVLDAMDNVIALGIKPVGAANWIGTATGEQAAFPSYLDSATLEGIEWLGDSKAPNIERIVALQPDLILGRNNRHGEIYDQLSAIAPTVIINQREIGGWREQFLAYADALNRTVEAETLLADYDARAASIAEKLAALDPVPEVSVVRFDPDRIVIYQRQIFAGSVVEDAGVTRPPQQDKDQRTERISLEQVEMIDGDVLFTVAANPEESILAELQENPLWGQLKAVQNEEVYAVSFDIWIGGWTISGANLILDDLEQYLLGN